MHCLRPELAWVASILCGSMQIEQLDMQGKVCQTRKGGEPADHPAGMVHGEHQQDSMIPTCHIPICVLIRCLGCAGQTGPGSISNLLGTNFMPRAPWCTYLLTQIVAHVSALLAAGRG